MTVYDRWHKTRPKPDEPTCDHGKVASSTHGKGDRWQVRWRDESGKQRKQNFATKGPADVFDTKQRADVHQGTSVDVVAARQSVSSYFEQWAETKIWREGSDDTIRSMFRNHIEPVIGHVAIGNVRASHIRTIMKRARENGKLATSSLSQLHTYVSTMFRAAVADRIIGTSPAESVKTPAPNREVDPKTIPTFEQVWTVIDTLADHVSAVAWIAAGCGLRIGEILGLELDSINWLKRTVTIRQQLVNPNSGKPYLGEPKTATSARTVDMPDDVANALAEHVRLNPVRTVEIVDRTDPRKPTTRQAQLIFTSTTGKPLRSSDWSKLWKPARDTAGLVAGVHLLRHFYASGLIASGTSPKEVQNSLGHSKLSVTLDTYTHLWPESDKSVRSVMNGVLSRVRAAQDQTASARNVP